MNDSQSNKGSLCAGCGAAFHCGVNDAQPCWCVEVTLDDTARDLLAQRYVGCLCAVCLGQAQRGTVPPRESP
jgi:hypothetical protein